MLRKNEVHNILSKYTLFPIRHIYNQMYVLIRSVVMDFLYRLRDLIVIFLINATLSQSLKIKNEFYRKNQETCMRIGKQPFFEIDLVLGKPWRIYYSWNLKLDTKCLDMTFRNATVGVSNTFLF